MTNSRSSDRVAKNEKIGLASAENRRSLVFSIILHLVMVAVLLFSWDFSESVKRVEQPASMKARVLSAAELEALRADKQQVKDAALKEKKKKSDLEAKKQQRLKDEKRRKDMAKKKAADKKKQDAAKKKALIKKKEKEQREKKAREEKQRQQEAERKKQEQEDRKKALEDSKKEAARSEKQLERERRLAERLAQATSSDAPVVQDASVTGSGLAEISERDRFIALIRSRVESRWHIPPKSRGLKVVLRIRLLPSVERSRVEGVSSSGSKAFDTSALNAVNSIRIFPVPDDPALFDRYFRNFLQSFSPPEE